MLTQIKDEILQQFTMEGLLQKGEVPEYDKVCALIIKQLGGATADESLVTDKFKVNYGEPASASKFNELTKNATIDIRTLYRFADEAYQKILKNFHTARQQLAALARKVSDIEAEAKGLALTQDLSKGPFRLFTETFANTTMVNTEKTTATIDVEKHLLKCGHKKDGSFIHDLKDLLKSAETRVITGRTLNSREVSPIENAFDGMDDTLFIQEVTVDNGAPDTVSLALFIKLKEKKEISSLSVKFSHLYGLNEYNASLSILSKGLWTGIGEATGKDSVEIKFQAVETDELMLTLSSSTPKTGTRTYLFTLKEIQIGLMNYSQSTVFESKPIEFDDFKFNSIGLITDELYPSGCKLDYFISFRTPSGINSQWSDFTPIEPINNGQIDYDKFVDVRTNLATTTTQAVLDYTINTPYNCNNNSCLNVKFDEPLQLHIERPYIIRAVGEFALASNGNYASLVFALDADKEMDFTQHKGILDGVSAQGIMIVPKGLHTFSFNRNGIENYKTFFNGISFGAFAAYYLEPDLFLRSVNNNKSLFTEVAINDVTVKYVMLVKELNEQETTLLDPRAENLLIIRKDLSGAEFADAVILKIELEGYNNLSPEVREFKIKAG